MKKNTDDVELTDTQQNGKGGGGASSQLLLQLDLFIISTIVTLKENWVFHISLNQFRHKNVIERKIINQNWKIVDSNWDFELWAGDAILQFYIIYGRGGSCQDLGRGSKLGFSMKTMLRAYMYIPSSQANLQRRFYVSNGTEKLAYRLLVPKCLTLPPLFIFFLSLN